jgi:hypothetical protein
MSPEEWRAAVFGAILQTISRLAAQKPVLLIVEDAHWVDSTSLDLLDTIVMQSSGLPMLVVVTSREEALAEPDCVKTRFSGKGWVGSTKSISCSDRFYQSADAQNAHYPFHVVGQDV